MALILQSFNNSLLLADFYWHNAAYARLCENKANLAMHCAGRCQVMKRMKTAQKKDEQGPDNRSSVKVPSPWCVAKTPFSLAPAAIAQAGIHGFPLTLGKPADRALSIFHPPPSLS